MDIKVSPSMRQFFLFLCSILLVVVIAPSSIAAIDTYQFSDEELRKRFHQLNQELRCPKCQNQNLADSDASIAADLREEVYRLLNEGNTDDQVKDYLVERYGEYVLYRPKWSKETWVLWLAPVFLLAVGVFVVLFMVRRRTSSVDKANSEPLNDQDQQRLEQLLHQEKVSQEKKQQENTQKEDN